MFMYSCFNHSKCLPYICNVINNDTHKKINLSDMVQFMKALKTIQMNSEQVPWEI